MAKGKKGLDGVDKVLNLFPASSHKMIERLLLRANEREAKAAGRGVKTAMRGAFGGDGRSGRSSSGRGSDGDSLAATLSKALHQRGDLNGGRASIRQKAPDTQGRPFHFAHSVVSKADALPSASGKTTKGAKGSNGASAGGGGKAGKAAAHMRYIEREIAVERTYGEGLDGVGEPATDRGSERDVSERDREIGRSADEKVHATSAEAGQGYIENPTKLANGEQIVFSFGTIGSRFQDRVEFWEALEEAEAHPSARVQHRLIVELPHEASGQARFDMVRAFTKRFEDDGIPYWAALHAPGKDNDSRNFHAHIVYSERPAKRMVDPAKPGSPEQWDFAITATYRKKSRNVVTRRPHRQDKLRAYHAKDFIPTVRKEFSEAVNAILARDDVRDKKGGKVLYDPRSYRDMGVDAVPMRSIDRIVASKLKDGTLTVLDGDYTKRMIREELREAAAKRQRDVMELIALENVLRAAVETKKPGQANAKLPKELRISPWANPAKSALRMASRKILEARHGALQIDVMERATTASLNRILAATEPGVVAAASRARDPVKKAEAPSADGARLLHAAARDELEDTIAAAAKARKSAAYRVGRAVDAWRSLVGGGPTEMAPAIRRMAMEERPQAAVMREDGPRQSPGRDASRVASRPKRDVGRDPGGRDGSGPGGTKSLEDALRIEMPTATEGLKAASRSVSGWVASIAEVEDYAERMVRLDALVAGLREGVKERQGRQTETRPAPVATAATEGVKDQGAEVSKDDGTAIKNERVIAEAAVSMRSPTVTVKAQPGRAGGEDEPVEGHPDDERRRKRREAEIERQKRMRQAVLARKNRGWER